MRTMARLVTISLLAFGLANLVTVVYANESGTKLEDSGITTLDNSRTFIRVGYIFEKYTHNNSECAETAFPETKFVGYGGAGLLFTCGEEKTYLGLLTLNRAANFHISTHKQKFSSAGIDAQLEFGLSFLKIGPALIISYARLYTQTYVSGDKSICTYEQQYWGAIPCLSITMELPVHGFFMNYKEGKSLYPDIKRYKAFSIGVRGTN